MRFSLIKKNEAFQRKLHESGCQEVATCRFDASKDLESPCSRDVSHGEVKIEETDGSHEVEEELSTWDVWLSGRTRGPAHHQEDGADGFFVLFDKSYFGQSGPMWITRE